jgi:hypothetical protein
MKKTLALLLVLCMALSVCGALADETQELKDARSYINLMYKNKPASTPKDYELVGMVPGDGENYTVEWTTDSDTITVTREESGLVKIDVNEDSPKEVSYKLTATILDAAGNSVSISFDRVVPAAINLDTMTPEEIVAVAYALDDGAALPTPTVLTGTIVAIPSAYSADYNNITVNIQVGDLADQPIQCYRLTGGASQHEGDEITVLGTIKNYKGTIEFDKGCFMLPAEGPCAMPEVYAQSARVAMFAYGLEEGAALSHESTMTGQISAIPSAYSDEYKNITVNIDVPGLEGYTVQCYRLTGEGAEALEEGDLITVTGTIKNYKGTIEFDKGCTFVPFEEEDLGPVPVAEEPAAEEPAAEEQGSAESFVLSLLGELGIDTTGYEAEISSAVGEIKNQLGDLKESSGGFLDSLKEGFGVFMNELGSGLESMFGELNEGVEQTKSNVASEVEQVRETVNAMLQEALEKDPESEETKMLSELAEAAKQLVEDDSEALSAFYIKVLDMLGFENK